MCAASSEIGLKDSRSVGLGSRALGTADAKAPVDDVPEDPVGLRLYPAYVSGAEGPERIAPPGGGLQDDSAIPLGSIVQRGRLLSAGPRPASRLRAYARNGGRRSPVV